jgi:ribosome-interacting GTPase 1
MPANLTPQYLAAEQRYKDAVTGQEKIEALEEMMAVIPKHKGTEKLRADLRRRLAKLRDESGRKHGVSRASAMYSVQREGAGQVVLVGGANTGKSSLLACLTNASPEIGDYAFTTRLPQPGMMPYENIQIQLVDMPPIDPNFYQPWMSSVARQADLILLIADLGTDALLEQVEGVLTLLNSSRIRLVKKSVPLEEPGTDILRQALLVANKMDAPGAPSRLDILSEFFGRAFDILTISAATREGTEDLRRRVFQDLNIIRVYTKVPGKKADLTSPPYVMKYGSTVMDAARSVHRGFIQSLKFAKVWSSGTPKHSLKYSGQMVERTHVLEDGDILELHI